MDNTQKEQITQLREEGLSYGMIADTIGISMNTVKTYCRRHGLGGKRTKETSTEEDGHTCLCCGKSVVQIYGRKEK